MIASLKGRAIGFDSNSVIIEVNGVGYRVMLSTQNLASLSEKGGEVFVLTLMIVRDDSLSLFGFFSEHEKQVFEKLISVSGVGPKVALSALSAFSADELYQLILNEDVSRLATIPGIGKKTAQRIILELRGVLDTRDQGLSGAPAVLPAFPQATEALLGMGFTAREVALALKGYEDDANDVEGLIRFGLKRLGAS